MFFLRLERPRFFLEHHQISYQGLFFKEKQLKKKFPIFCQNHGLTPFEKWTFPTVLK